MATADDIRSGIKTLIVAAFPTLNVYDRWRGNVTPPCVVMDYPRPVQELSFGGGWAWNVQVQLQLLAGDTESGDENLAAYLDTSGSSSMIVALHGDKTLGGTVSSVRCSGVSDVGVTDHGDGNAVVLVATWDVEVYE